MVAEEALNSARTELAHVARVATLSALTASIAHEVDQPLPGIRVRVTVRDAGVGLTPQALGSLFDAFYTTKSGGMGIGLFVSRSIVDRHQGRRWAEPNDGPSATFSFSVPCQTA
jgi:signal transduction histidine kinase